jgi:hypothetical protein
MHFAFVLEDLDSLCQRWLKAHNRTSLFKVPAIIETIAAEVTFAGRLIEWYTALVAERLLKQSDILQAFCTIGNSPAASQACGAGKAVRREENIKKGSPEFCSEKIVHSHQGFVMHTDICLTLQRAVCSI